MKLHNYASTYSRSFDVYTLEYGIQLIHGHFVDRKEAEQFAYELFLTYPKKLPVFVNEVFVKHTISKVVS